MALNMTELTKWQRAAQRALAADLPHQLRQRGNSILVPSKSDDGKTYHVQVLGGLVGQCDCQAGLPNRPCAHKAAVALRLLERSVGQSVKIRSLTPAGLAAMNSRILGA